MKTVEEETALTTIRHLKAYNPCQAPGFFEVELRVQWLLAKDNSLSRLDAVIDWESFRPLLAAVWDKPARQYAKAPSINWHSPVTLTHVFVPLESRIPCDGIVARKRRFTGMRQSERHVR